MYRAWERCHVLGASPEQARAESLSASATEAYLKQRADLVSAAQPFMAALSRAAAADRHAAMLGDENGIVLDIVGDEETVHGPEPFAGPGALLAEEVSGANGIGTPLAEGDYVEPLGVHRPQALCRGLIPRGPRGRSPDRCRADGAAVVDD